MTNLLSNTLLNKDVEFKTPIEGTPSGQLAFAVKKGENPELIEMFNNGLANLKKSGQYQKILDKYLKADSKSSTSSTTADETTIWGLLPKQPQTIVKWFGCDSCPCTSLFRDCYGDRVLSSGCLVLAPYR